MYTGVHSDAAWESYSSDLFDIPLNIPLECKKSGDTWLMYPCKFSDLRCESVTYIYKLYCFIIS